MSRAVRAAQSGDQDAICFLYARYVDNVYGYVRSFVQNDHDAEDVTQGVFMKVIASIDRYEQQRVPFLAWVIRIARNAALDQIRSRRAIPVEEVRRTDFRDELRASEHMGELRGALAELPAEQREVLVLRHVVGLSPSEIAAQLGRSESSIHGLHHRGRRALKQALVERDAAPVTKSA